MAHCLLRILDGLVNTVKVQLGLWKGTARGCRKILRGLYFYIPILTEKLSHFTNKARDQDFEPFRSWFISKSNAYDFTWSCLLRWLFEPSQNTKCSRIGNINYEQASAWRRRPRRPGFPNSMLPSWDSWFLSQMFAHQAQRLWTKTRTSATTIRTGTRASKVQDGEDVDVPRSPDYEDDTIFTSNKNVEYSWCSEVEQSAMKSMNNLVSETIRWLKIVLIKAI